MIRFASLFAVRRAVVFLFAAASSAFAGEYAVLRSGFKIHVQAYVVEGDKVKLQTDGGTIVIAAGDLQSIEVEEYTPPASPTAQVPPIPTSAVSQQDPKQLLAEAASHAGVPTALVNSVAKAESGFRPYAISPKGAIGLMQLMPGTAASLNANPYDPKQNAEAGAAYLRDLLVRYENDPQQVTKAIAAYNAGPAAVDKYNGVPPYQETVDYVNRVVKQYLKSQDAK